MNHNIYPADKPSEVYQVSMKQDWEQNKIVFNVKKFGRFFR